MLTTKKRAKLGCCGEHDGFVGFDCDGRKISIGHKVKVIKEEKFRKGDKKCVFCSKEKIGTVYK